MTISSSGYAQHPEPAKSSEAFARQVSDLIIEGTESHFEPALQKFDQEGANWGAGKNDPCRLGVTLLQ